jgi:erythromycin esterase-like protein
VRNGLPGSHEALFHHTGHPQFWLALRGNEALASVLAHPRLQRAIGVIYQPQTERASHYVHAHLPAQFDAMVHIDSTQALEPLELEPDWLAQEEPAETFPSGL